MTFRAAPALLATLAVILAGCGDPSAFDAGVAKGVAEAEPFQLDSEQVSMNLAQLDCGAGEDLWEAPRNSGGRSFSRLEAKGHNLNLTDDVYSGDSEYPNPYTQVRGKFALQVDQVHFDQGWRGQRHQNCPSQGRRKNRRPLLQHAPSHHGYPQRQVLSRPAGDTPLRTL